MGSPQTGAPSGPVADILAMIAAKVTDTSAQGIARTISGLITADEIKPGDSLPTVRATAAALGVSSSTVSAAWRLMQTHGMIATDRRRGTTVRSSRGSIEGRYWQVPVPAGTFEIDLSTGTPDQTLLPNVGAILHRIHADVAVGSYLDASVLPGLEAELRRRWPFTPERITVVDGAQDALDRLVSALIRIGDTVVVEQPTFPPVLDMLELAGADVIGIELDNHGPRLDQLSSALGARPTAMILQPRAHNPTAISITPDRAAAIADLLEPHDVWLIEDDHSGDIAGVDLACVSALRPDRSLLIHSYSKSHGPDLRIAAIGGPEAPLRTLERRRALGPSWTSRLTQQILLEMLTDPAVEAQVALAASTYRQRREAFASALDRNGIDVPVGAGLNIAIPVNDEQSAVVYLAAHRIGAAPGRPFLVDPTAVPRSEFVRLSIGGYAGDPEPLAATVAQAARA